MARKLGLLGKAVFGGLAGAADVRTEQFQEDGKAKRQRQRDAYLQEGNEKLLDTRLKFEGEANKLREKGATDRFNISEGSKTAQHKATLDQALGIARQASTERITIAQGNAAVQLAIRNGQISAESSASAERIVAATFRAEEAKSAADFRTETLKWREIESAAKTLRDETQNAAEREHWKRVETNAAEQAKAAELRHADRPANTDEGKISQDVKRGLLNEDEAVAARGRLITDTKERTAAINNYEFLKRQGLSHDDAIGVAFQSRSKTDADLKADFVKILLQTSSNVQLALSRAEELVAALRPTKPSDDDGPTAPATAPAPAAQTTSENKPGTAISRILGTTDPEPAPRDAKDRTVGRTYVAPNGRLGKWTADGWVPVEDK